MKLGYADESGEPGVRLNDHDYFVFSVVVVKNRLQSEKIATEITNFRVKNNLPEDYEFHYIENSKRVREAFTEFIRKLDFKFYTVSIKKTGSRRDASNSKMAENIINMLAKHRENISIEMDKNPQLYSQIRSKRKLINAEIHCAEKESRGHDLIQLADYVTSLRARFLKYPKKSSAIEMYGKIADKLIDSVDL